MCPLIKKNENRKVTERKQHAYVVKYVSTFSMSFLLSYDDDDVDDEEREEQSRPHALFLI